MMPPEKSPKNWGQPIALHRAPRYRDAGLKVTLSHHLEEGCLELVHLFLRPDRDANMSRPARPHAADVDLLLWHGGDDLLPGPPTSTMKQLETDGMYLKLCFSRKLSTSSRTSPMILRRLGTRSFA